MPDQPDRPAAGTGGDPLRTIELLWGVERPPKRGPRPRLAIPEITRAAVRIADAEGLAGVSVRRVAGELGVAAMSLYTYVPGKAELVDLMVDAVLGEIPRPDWESWDWRRRLETVARDNRALCLRHPWLLAVAMNRPVMGPNLIAKYDHELRAVEGVGLDDVEMDSVLTLVLGYVHGSARSQVDALDVQRRTGMSDAQWWELYGPALATVLDPERYPVAVRVGAAAGELHQAAYDPEHAFEFGLARLLDGVELLITRRA